MDKGGDDNVLVTIAEEVMDDGRGVHAGADFCHPFQGDVSPTLALRPSFILRMPAGCQEDMTLLSAAWMLPAAIMNVLGSLVQYELANLPLCVVNIVLVNPLQVLVGIRIDLVIPDYGLANLRIEPPCVQ